MKMESANTLFVARHIPITIMATVAQSAAHLAPNRRARVRGSPGGTPSCTGGRKIIRALEIILVKKFI